MTAVCDRRADSRFSSVLGLGRGADRPEELSELQAAVRDALDFRGYVPPPGSELAGFLDLLANEARTEVSATPDEAGVRYLCGWLLDDLSTERMEELIRSGDMMTRLGTLIARDLDADPRPTSDELYRELLGAWCAQAARDFFGL